MVFQKQENQLVYGIKLSSVGPATVTGTNVVYEPTGIDLAMKLHYLRGVYYFRDTTQTIFHVMKIKESMFYWLNHYFIVNGRFRRSDSGRPYIKCNDCGVRLIEAKCSKTLEEWLEMLESEDDDGSLHKLLVSNQVIGPELAFSPLVLIQFTLFECGGFSVGLSWAHVLGDAYSASDFINMWGHLFSGHKPTIIPDFPKSQTIIHRRPDNPSQCTDDPLSMKRVDPVGDNWICPPMNCKIVSYSFRISSTTLSDMQSNVSKIPTFETICAFIWKIIAKIKTDGRDKFDLVTVIRNEYVNEKTIKNSQIINTVEANFNVTKATVEDIAKLLVVSADATDEKGRIEESMEREDGQMDCIVYGTNLTFVNWEENELYGLELKGENPVLVNYTIDGVGKNGVVLVLPWTKDSTKEDDNGGRFVTVILPEDEMVQLKHHINKEWRLL